MYLLVYQFRHLVCMQNVREKIFKRLRALIKFSPNKKKQEFFVLFITIKLNNFFLYFCNVRPFFCDSDEVNYLRNCLDWNVYEYSHCGSGFKHYSVCIQFVYIHTSLLFLLYIPSHITQIHLTWPLHLTVSFSLTLSN